MWGNVPTAISVQNEIEDEQIHENQINLTEIENEVADIRANTVSSSSRVIYVNSISRFLVCLIRNKRYLIPQTFLEKLFLYYDDETIRIRVKDLLDGDDNNPPIYFDQIQAQDFMSWLLTLRKKNGVSPGYSTFNSHRAAFFNLFRLYKVTMSAELTAELATHFKGLSEHFSLQLFIAIQI